MAYITIEELEARFDVRTVAQLSNDEDSEVRNDDAVEAAIADASDLVDAKLRVRKTVPLSVVDSVIKRITADLAMAGLAKRRAGEVSPLLTDREKTALELLDDIASGKIQISVADSLDAGAKTISPPPLFGNPHHHHHHHREES